MKHTALLIRPVALADSEHLWQWRNDPQTREMSLSTQLIEWPQHHAWFLSVLNDASQYIYIGYFTASTEQNNETAVVPPVDLKVGMVRFDIAKTDNTRELKAIISINLNPLYRGQGLASVLLIKAIETFKQKMFKLNKLGTLHNNLQTNQYNEIGHADTLIITAIIKDSNRASLHAFSKAGFIRDKTPSAQNQERHQLILKLL